MQSWLCPNNRQLRLRACIARGWSTPRDAVASLTSDECAAIGNVLRRDRALRMLDCGRVGRVAEQVDRQRLAQRGDGQDNCRRCGRRLRHRWWLSSVRCVDCQCRFCDECTTLLVSVGETCSQAAGKRSQPLQAWICKLCREIRLLTAKSGAWFHPRYGLREPSPDPPMSSEYGNQSPSPDASTEGPETADRDVLPPIDSPWSKVTSLPNDSSLHSHTSAYRRRALGKKSLSHSDLPSYQTEKHTQHHNIIDKLHLTLHLPLHLPLHLGHKHRGKSSPSLNPAEQLQREYFPTELSDE